MLAFLKPLRPYAKYAGAGAVGLFVSGIAVAAYDVVVNGGFDAEDEVEEAPRKKKKAKKKKPAKK